MEMRSIGNNLIVLWEQIERIGLLVTILPVSLEMQNLAWLRRMFFNGHDKDSFLKVYI